MRLLMWIFVATIVTFFSSVRATSAAANSDETQFGHLPSKEFDTSTRLLFGENDDTSQRFLRSDTTADLTTSTDNSAARSEERGLIPSKLTNLLRNVKGKWNTNALVAKVKGSWAKLKDSWLEKAIKHMEKKGETPNQAYDRLTKKGHLTKSEEVLLKAYLPRFKANNPEFKPQDELSKLLQ
ncbi:hypothetical protein L916_12366 [Phytophthora nicotianae]|uniref:RxLR effector protein n=1 Tax=Phytophthora nicotianae TaxID=4792 RepID=W2IQ50_PHYNI|nr:hypothetical protein L916_12366 [Phytophthora nicotianae]